MIVVYPGYARANPMFFVTVGGGQTGLHLAARFKQMNILALVVEREARIGDVWRKRYPSLTLHTPRRHHSCELHLFPFCSPNLTTMSG